MGNNFFDEKRTNGAVNFIDSDKSVKQKLDLLTIR